MDKKKFRILVFTRMLPVILVTLLIFSLSACSGSKSGNGLGDITVGSAENSQPDVVTESPDDTDNADGNAEEDFERFLPTKEDMILSFPEYSNDIIWSYIPQDYIGGDGAVVEPKADNNGYVNVRKTPGVDADIVGEMHRDSDYAWVLLYEQYQDEEGIINFGWYEVKLGDYTWTLVFNNGTDESGPIIGWVALEVVDMWGI